MPPGLAVQGPFSARALQVFNAARTQYRADSTNIEGVWHFAQACFDVAEYATNNAERAAFAQQGIEACRDQMARSSQCPQVHYYLGLNLGQLARTKSLGALKLVTEMEREFVTARGLDERLDYAGPDRTLGFLYRDAPAFGSVGNKRKARLHLERAVALAPDYPDQRLGLIEAFIEWNEPINARRELKELETRWPRAQAKFTGEAWAPSWVDWEARLRQAKKKLGLSGDEPRPSR